MTVTIATSPDCGCARVSAYCRHLATVMTVQGEIDAANIDRVSAYTRRLILAKNPLVLDLSDLGSISDEARSFLDAVAEDCRAAGVEWTLVAPEAALGEKEFPRARSVCEALKEYDDEITLRRQLLLELIKKTA